MKIGHYEIEALETGKFRLDGGAMFGIIPKPLWEKTNPADEVNRVQLSARSLLLRGNGRLILIDTGMGAKWDEKARKIYNIEQPSDPVISALADKGISRDDITDVILTHLHFDHTGGSTEVINGKAVPAFPHATYYTQKKNFEWAQNPTDRDRGSYIPQNFLPLMEEGVLKLIEGNFRFDDNIEMIQINGHTMGQQLIKISDGSSNLLFSGDLLPFSSHVHLPFIMGYDLQPLVTLEEKKKILKTAAEEEWILCFEHDPYTPACTVESSGSSFKIKERKSFT